jgi:hypothetical protein
MATKNFTIINKKNLKKMVHLTVILAAAHLAGAAYASDATARFNKRGSDTFSSPNGIQTVQQSLPATGTPPSKFYRSCSPGSDLFGILSDSEQEPKSGSEQEKAANNDGDDKTALDLATLISSLSVSKQSGRQNRFMRRSSPSTPTRRDHNSDTD